MTKANELFRVLLALTILLSACAVSDAPAADLTLPQIGLSRAIPVVARPVVVSWLGDSVTKDQVLEIVTPANDVLRLPIDASGKVAWTPKSYGKHVLKIDQSRTEVWVTTLPLTFHWWDALTSKPRFVTVAMGNPEKDSQSWRARGVIPVSWAAGECNRAGWTKEKIEQDGWITPHDWFNGWYGQNETNRLHAGGIAIDEACLQMADQPLTTVGITGAMNLTREAAGADFHIALYATNIADPGSAWHFRSTDSEILIENYAADLDETIANWQQIASRWRFTNRALLTIAPGYKHPTADVHGPLTPTQVRRNVANQRLAAPEMRGLGMFNAYDTNLDVAVDQAIEDYFLKPVLFVRPKDGRLVVENVGQSDAKGVTAVFQDEQGRPIERSALSTLRPFETDALEVPDRARALRLDLPDGMASLYERSTFPLPATLSPPRVVDAKVETRGSTGQPGRRVMIRLSFDRVMTSDEQSADSILLAGRSSGLHHGSISVEEDGKSLLCGFDDLPDDRYMFCFKGGVDEPLVDAHHFGLDGDDDGFIEPFDWYTLFFTLTRRSMPAWSPAAKRTD